MLVVQVKWEGGSKNMRMLFISAVALGVIVGETAALNVPASQVSHSAMRARTVPCAPSAEAPSMHLRGGLVMKTKSPMVLYCCLKKRCGWGSKRGGRYVDFVDHAQWKHHVDITLGPFPADQHWCHCYCNSCPRKNGHGMRLNNSKEVLDHLREVHDVPGRE